MTLPLWRLRRDNTVIQHNLVSVAALTFLMPLISFQNSAAVEAQKVEATPVRSEIRLTIDTPAVISTDKKLSEIKPGESLAQKQAREAQERAQAEAEKQRLEAEARSRAVISRDGRSNDPANFDEIYARAEAAYGVDARLLRAVHYVETGGSGSTSKQSYAGAVGPMQFLPSTFRRYGVDANGNGVAEITNVEDSIFAAARYLKACGYPDVKKALWGYNPSASYYNKVMKVARSLGFNG